MTFIDRALLLLEDARIRLAQLRGHSRFRPSSEYFRDCGLPSDPEYLEELDRINASFVDWIDPGVVEAPSSAEIEDEGDGIVRFASARPTGRENVDRVALRVYPVPDGAPDVGILFHHWIYLDGWGPIDYLLKPLRERYRVAVMIAPHHMMRREPGWAPGEGFLNPNVLDIFGAVRQWQSDHARSIALLRRDHGFEDTVLLGYSLGGFGSLLARMFHGPCPTVAVCVTNHLARGVTEGISSRGLVERLWEAGFSYGSFWWSTRSLHLADWAPFIGGTDLTWMYAREDRIEPRESIAEPIDVLRPDKTIELPGGHSTAALFRDRIAAEVAEKVEQQLASRRRPRGLPSAG